MTCWYICAKIKEIYKYLNVHYMYTFFIVPNIYIRNSTESILFVAGNVRGLLKGSLVQNTLDY